ncbi:uncharacterized protein LOC134620391 [Pelmatolapia mariae]|uniref:uncharacterized protein LOC134620391 n=1 Tax=Pelmatolapia mariae TaxID=158779 RepID=UPI002FE59E8C
MKKGKSKRGQKNTNQSKIEEAKIQKRMEPHDKEDGGCLLSSHQSALPESGGDGVILREITKVSKELGSFKDKVQESLLGLTEDIGKKLADELAAFKQELNQKLLECAATQQSQGKAIAEAEGRIAEIEESGMVTKEALLGLLKGQCKLREKVIDLESRSRRNNIRIYGVPEDAEGESIIAFAQDLLQKELPLPEGLPLQIQRAHRALSRKPGPDATPRSIIINFLQLDVKETVLRLAWKKKVLLGNKQIFFDHDYAYEVMEKRKSYTGIKKALKERNIRFQTPFTRIHIHWSTGPRTYEDAEDAAKELRARGIEVAPTRANPGPSTEERVLNAFSWHGVETERDRGPRMKTRVRRKLREYRRDY